MRTLFRASLAGLATVVVFSATQPPVYASCVVCGAGGECTSVETSGNCSCNIKITNRNFHICKPVGICDPNDVNTCSEGPPPNNVRALRVNPAGLRTLENQDSLIGAALWAAVDAAFAPDGTCTGSYIRMGSQEGTLGGAEGDYSFQVTATESADGGIELHGLLTSTAGDTIEFRGDLREAGRVGQITVERDSRGIPPRVLGWKVDRPSEK